VPVTLGDVRELALSLPRSYEAVVRGRVKFRVGQIVYVAFSHDGETMGFGFPKELRNALVQVAHVSRVVLVAASRRTRRIVSTSSAAVMRECGPNGRWATGVCDASSSGSASAMTGIRWRAFRLFE
jgi:hypothetical protein